MELKQGRRRAPERLRVGGDEATLRITSADSGGAVLAFDVAVPPGGGPPMLHRHAAFEAYRVEAGELALYVEDDAGEVRRVAAGPGEVVAIPGGREHTVRNESDAPARAFVTMAPGAEMERFARAAAALSEGAGPHAAGALIQLARAHGITMTRPVPL